MMRKITVLFISFALCISSHLISYSVFTEKFSAGYSDDTVFIHTDGQLLTDENGEQFIVKGMAFGNCVWDNPKTPVLTHHDEDSYKELRQLGFNTVRFYLNYGLFEDDSAPYVYKESGFEWLDKNILWAKKYGIKLILNMHYPQGGFQSLGNGTDLWTKSENQDRLAALWTEIAARYAEEPTILGYGLVNEPIVPFIESNSKSFALWQNLAQKITEDIREVNTKHLIFIERLCGIKNMETGILDKGNFNNDSNYFLVEGENIVYEFHNYDPFYFTHQDESWAGTSGIVKSYPNGNEVFAEGAVWATGTFNGEAADVNETDWQYLESSIFTVNGSSNLKLCSAVFQARYLGENGNAYMDDFTLKEISPDGTEKIIYIDNFNSNNEFNFWSSNGSGDGYHDEYTGNDSVGSICINGVNDDANFTKGYFIAKPGYGYRACAWVKLGNGCLATADVRPRVDFYTAESVFSMDKDYLEARITECLDFGTINNVPLYCGEFGTNTNSFKESRGGEQWVEDYIEICEKYNVNWNYHTYHEASFGLYTNSPYQTPDKRNDELYAAFERLLNTESKKNVIFDSNGGTVIESQTVSQGETATMPDITRLYGYVFKGWYSDSDFENSYNFSAPVTDDLILYAKFEINSKLDIFKDGKILAPVHLKRWILNYRYYNEIEMEYADFVKDGDINIADLVFLKRALAEWEGYNI